MDTEHGDHREGPEKNGLFAEMGARIVKSLLVWGLAAILASSAYTDIVKIAGLRAKGTRTDTLQEASAPIGGQEPEPGAPPEAEEAPDTGSGDEPDPQERKVAALTFDDGPHPVYTRELLDGLKEREARATFFVVGSNIPGNEELIRRMAQEGHLIGNHTYDHVKISDLDAEEACLQIEKTSALIREITGKDTEFVRPPFGEWNRDMESPLVMIPVLWDVDPRDWSTKNVSDIVRRVLEDTEDGDIILLHDYYESSVQAALEIVDRLQAQGYRFVTVDELILE